MAQLEKKLPIVFTEIVWSEHLAGQYGKINTQNLIIKAMNLVTDIIKEHGGKIIQATNKQVFCTFPNTKKAIQAVCKKQRDLNGNEKLYRIDTALKIGLHSGEVTVSKDDVSGMVVTIAKKLMGYAKPNQILLTRDVLQEVPVALNIQMTARGKLKTKDRIGKIDVFEAHWNQDNEEHTVYMGDNVEKQSVDSSMTIQYLGKKYRLGSSKPSFLIGRINENDIIIDDNLISRNHATITLSKGRFRLADTSTNGTYVQMGSGQEQFLHNESTQLIGEGFISLGRKIEREDSIHVIQYSIDC